MSLQTLPANPFVGLRPFRSDENPLFFGRQGDIEAFLHLFHHNGFIFLEGDSGVGKTSFIQAGIIPCLKAGFSVEGHNTWFILSIAPGSNPLKNLAKSLIETVHTSAEREKYHRLLTKLQEDGGQIIKNIFDGVLNNRKANLLLIVDHYEELFVSENGNSSSEIGAFNSILKEIIGNHIFVLLCARSDFACECREIFGLEEAQSYTLPALNRVQLKEIIEVPLRLYNTAITPWLIEQMLLDVESASFPLPRLQHVLKQLWEEWQESGMGRPIDTVYYKAVGTARNALSIQANEALQHLSENEKTFARQLFLSLVTKEESGRRVCRSRTLHELQAELNVNENTIAKIVDLFYSGGRSLLLMTEDKLEQDFIVKLPHESLTTLWNTFREWREANQRSIVEPGKRVIEEIVDTPPQAPVFPQNDRTSPTPEKRRPSKRFVIPASAFAAVCLFVFAWLFYGLQSGKPAEKQPVPQQVSTIEQNRPIFDSLPADTLMEEKQLAFIADLQQDAPEPPPEKITNPNQTGTVQADTQSTSFSPITTSNSEVPDLSAIEAPSGIDSSSMVNAEPARSSASSLTTILWTNAELALKNDDWLRASHFLALAIKNEQNREKAAEGMRQIHELTKTVYLLTQFQLDTPVLGTCFSHNGKILATWSADKTVQLWNTSDGVPLFPPLKHNGEVWGVLFSANDQYILTWGAEGTLFYHKLGNLANPATLTRHDDIIKGVAFSKDGRYLLSWSLDGTARLWRSDGDVSTFKILKHKEGVVDAVFSPDNRFVLTFTYSGEANQWKITGDDISSKVLRDANGLTKFFAGDFSPDEKVVLAVSDRRVLLWDTQSGDLMVNPLESVYGKLAGARFSHQGYLVLTWDSYRYARLWKTLSGEQLSQPMEHIDGVTGALFNQNDNVILTWGNNNTARIWQITKGSIVAGPLIYHNGIHSAQFCNDARWIFTWSGSGNARLWSTEDASPASPLMTSAGNFDGAVFSDDGEKIVTWGKNDRRVRIWKMNRESAASEIAAADSLVDYDFPPEYFPLMIETHTGTIIDNNNVLKILSVEGWQKRRSSFIEVVKAHRQECKYKSGNSYLGM